MQSESFLKPGSLWSLWVNYRSTNRHLKIFRISNSRHDHDRSSCTEVFCKKGVFGNFAKFTGKHLYQSLSFNKVAGLMPANLSQKRLAQVFFCEFYEIFIDTFSYRTPQVAASVTSSQTRQFMLWKSVFFVRYICTYPKKLSELGISDPSNR